MSSEIDSLSEITPIKAEHVSEEVTTRKVADGGAAIENGLVVEKRVWFEKTVEYLFALTNFKGYDLICPLAGKHERAGDVIGTVKARWFVIEFKRFGPNQEAEEIGQVLTTKEKLNAAEKVKFLGPKSAQDELLAVKKSMGPFHNIVYGVVENGSENLGLEAHDYWDSLTKRESIADLLTHKYTCEKDKFDAYVKLFMKAKGGNPRGRPPKENGKGTGGGEDGPIQPPQFPNGGQGVIEQTMDDLEFTNVFAITIEGKERIFCAPIRDFYSFLNCSSDDGGNPDGEDGNGGNRPLSPDDGSAGNAAIPVFLDIPKIISSVEINEHQPVQVR